MSATASRAMGPAEGKLNYTLPSRAPQSAGGILWCDRQLPDFCSNMTGTNYALSLVDLCSLKA